MTLEINETFAYFNLYFSTLLWLIISLLGFVDSARLHRQAKRAYLLIRDFDGDGDLYVAEGRYKVSLWFIRGFTISFVVAIIATAFLFFTTPPPPENTVSSFVLRYLLPITLFCWWRAKRINIETSNRLEALDIAEKALNLRKEPDA